jgi:Spy/CpxP family protein refolding chaperone
MKRMLARTVIAVVLTAGLVGVALAQAPGGRGQAGPGMRQGMGPGGPGGPGNPMAALKLTPDQRTQVQAIQENHRQSTQGQAEHLRALQEQLRAALFGESPDQAVELARQAAPLEAELLPARVAMQAEIVKLLTPEQKKIAASLNLFGGNGMMNGPGGPGGPAMQGRRGPAPVKK